MSDPQHSETVDIGPVHVGRHVGPHAPMTGRWVCADDCPHPDHSAESEHEALRGENERLRVALRKVEYLGSQSQSNAAVHMGMIARHALRPTESDR